MATIGSAPTAPMHFVEAGQKLPNSAFISKRETASTYRCTIDEVMASTERFRQEQSDLKKKAPAARGTETSEEEESANKHAGKPRSFFRRLFGQK